MSKFNRSISPDQRLAARPDATLNEAGGLAFRVDPETELYLRACTALLEDRYYTDADAQLAGLRNAARRCSRRYVLQVANYARNRMHLRSVPIMLLAEASAMQSAPREPKPDVREYVPKIVRRADEPMELLAYWIRHIGGGSKANFPNALREGLSAALRQFDEYELAKWDRRRSGSVWLKDVISLAHPVPDTPERSDLYRRALDGRLRTPETWEVIISTGGSTAENWDRAAETMGIFALLRNLRNFEKTGAEKAIRTAIARFTDPESVRSSRLLPFRWYQAYRHVTRQDLRDAILTALDLSVGAIEPWSGTTAIICDNSGSMQSPLSRHGDTQYIDVAALLGAMAAALSPDGYRVGVFATDFAWVDGITRRDSVLTNVGRIAGTYIGGATHAHKALEAMIRERVAVDRVVLLSDMQCYNAGGNPDGPSLAAAWERYRREVSPGARLYSVDLAGYGTVQFVPDDPSVVLLAGWNDAVLDFVRYFEAGRTAVDEIKARW